MTKVATSAVTVARLGRILPYLFFVYVVAVTVAVFLELCGFPLLHRAGAQAASTLTVAVKIAFGVICIPTFVAIPILFVWWQAAAAEAIVERWPAGNPPTSPGRQFASWFIPIANIWLPLKALGTLYLYSQAGAEENSAPAKFPRVVLLWWFFWTVGPFLMMPLLGALLPDKTTTRPDIYFMAPLLLAALYAATIVRDVTDFQAAWPRPAPPADPSATSHPAT